MNTDIPYFLTNKEWYTEDDVPLKDFLDGTFKGRIYKLTEKATKEAIESYNEYCAQEDNVRAKNNSANQLINENLDKTVS